MKYRFHRCRAYAELDLQGWYLEVRPDDAETLMKLHRGVAALYFDRFSKDPHLDPYYYSPVKLAASWFSSISKFLLAGKIVLVNPQGGMMLMEDSIILETVESDNIAWHVRFEDEVITISRWLDAKHYYLSSNKFYRMFVPEKYNTFEMAYEEALRYVPKERIKTKNC